MSSYRLASRQPSDFVLFLSTFIYHQLCPALSFCLRFPPFRFLLIFFMLTLVLCRVLYGFWVKTRVSALGTRTIPGVLGDAKAMSHQVSVASHRGIAVMVDLLFFFGCYFCLCIFLGLDFLRVSRAHLARLQSHPKSFPCFIASCSCLFLQIFFISACHPS